MLMSTSRKYRSYDQKIAEWDLYDKPKKYIKHCLERIARAQNITSEEVKEIESDVGFISRVFQVKSMPKESYHKAYIPDLRVQRLEEVLDAVQTFSGRISACSRCFLEFVKRNLHNLTTFYDRIWCFWH